MRGIKKISDRHNITSLQVSSRDINKFWNDYGKLKGNNITSQETAAKTLSTKRISKIIKTAYGKTIPVLNTNLWKSSVATRTEIQEDVKKIIKSDQLYLIKPPFSHNLSIRAIPGHAQNGHSMFSEKKINTDIDAVLRGLEGSEIKGLEGLTLNGFKNQSQETIDGIVHFVEDYFSEILKNPSKEIPNPLRKPLTRQGEEIGGLTFLKHQKINMLEFMRGFYFASLMDNHEDIRAQVKSIYGYEMGGGDTFPMKRDKLMEYGIGLTQLSEKKPSGLLKIIHSLGNEKTIRLLTHLKIIEEQQDIPKEFNPLIQNWDILKEEYGIDLIKNPNLKNQYLRYQKGLGCSDDTAIFLASFLPKTYSNSQGKNAEISRFIGALLADHIDTVEKDARILLPGGQDEIVGQYFNQIFQTACRINKKFREKFNIPQRKDDQYSLVPKRTVIDFTAASANMSEAIIHSSQRWFYKSVQGTCALSEYIKQVFATARYLGKETPPDRIIEDIYKADMTSGTPPIKLTFKQIPLEKIINTFRERQELIHNPGERERNLLKFYLNH